MEKTIEDKMKVENMILPCVAAGVITGPLAGALMIEQDKEMRNMNKRAYYTAYMCKTGIQELIPGGKAEGMRE